MVSELDADYPIKTSSKNDDHWVQMENTRRFQRFVEDYSFDPLVYEAEEYDLTSITEMPISLVVGSEDKFCPLSRAEWLADQVSNVQNFYVIENAGRTWSYNNNSPQYVELLLNEVYSQDLLPEMNKQSLPASSFGGRESALTGATATIALIKAILRMLA